MTQGKLKLVSYASVKEGTPYSVYKKGAIRMDARLENGNKYYMPNSKIGAKPLHAMVWVEI